MKKIKLALLSDSASQLLAQALRGHGFESQVDFELFEADYNQVDQQVFDPASELYVFRPSFVFINLSSEHLLKDFYSADGKQQSDFGRNRAEKIMTYCQAVQSGLGAKVILNTFVEINDGVYGNYAAKTNKSFIYQVRVCNLMLMEYAQKNKDLYICDLALLQAASGYEHTFDPKMYVNGDMVYSIDFLPVIARHISDIILSVSGVFKKCLIMDLDNTLWGGIIGDDGMEGIELGDLGIGKAFTLLQSWARQLSLRGIILAVCSKNTEAIALEPFEKHPDMVLRREDIAVFAVNWETKVQNIRHIQQVLNIGFDSMVFLDDNPFEREMVKSAIAGITVPDLPEDPADYLPYLRTLNLFETALVTEEDQQRNRQYREEAERNDLQQRFENEGEFLQSLSMQAIVKPFDRFSAPRVAQLSQRSNQFNLRTIRYTEDEINKILSSPEYLTRSFSLSDRIGDHGLISIIILKKLDSARIFIDTWIMSCRVLKRGVEKFVLNEIADMAQGAGYTRLIGEYLPTRKNGIVQDHYKQLGFTLSEGLWELDLTGYNKLETFINYK